jgi:hypothetical protein
MRYSIYKITLLLFLTFFFENKSFAIEPNILKIENNFNILSIENGWYNSITKYTNYKTGTIANYRLSVKVEYDKVTAISFGNGGSVHSGLNNEGYIYSGGFLNTERDYNGRIIAYTARVSVTDSNGIRTFDVRIE